MGTPDDKLFVDPKDRDDLPEILDDLDPVPPVWKSTSDAIEQTQSRERRLKFDFHTGLRLPGPVRRVAPLAKARRHS